MQIFKRKVKEQQNDQLYIDFKKLRDSIKKTFLHILNLVHQKNMWEGEN